MQPCIVIQRKEAKERIGTSPSAASAQGQWDGEAWVCALPQKVSNWREGSKIPMPSTHTQQSALGEVEFSAWLEQKLAHERTALLKRLQDKVSQQLAEHHQTIHQQLIVHADPGGAAHGSAGPATPPAAAAKVYSDWRGGADNLLRVEEEPVMWPPIDRLASGASDAAPVMVNHRSSANDNSTNRMSTRSASKDTRTSERTSHHEFKSAQLAKLHSLHNKQEEQQEFRGFAARLVHNPIFEVICSALIILNTIIMAVEVQYTGCRLSQVIGHQDCPDGADDRWPGAETVFTVISTTFTFVFLLELFVRVAAVGRKAIRSGWIWFDVVLVAMGSMDLADRLGGSWNMLVNPTMMRTARVARMLRMMKVLKARDGFQSLFLLLKSLQASKQALFWSSLLLTFTMTSVGMFMNQLLQGHLVDSSLSLEDRRLVFDYFGTYTRTLITMFELTLGNWAPPSRLLMDRISEYWGLFIVIYRCVFCFAIVNVTGAVFITETNRAAANDDEVMLMKKERANKANAKRLTEIFKEMDETGDGHVTFDEFLEIMDDPVMVHFLSTMDVDLGDMHEVFAFLDNGNGKIDCNDFVSGILALRGQAKSIDLLTVLKVARRIDGTVAKLDRHLCAHVARTPDEGLAPLV